MRIRYEFSFSITVSFLISFQVVFRNPAWKAWLEGVVKEVCRTLGVNYAASQPRSELYKLLLYETGSQCVVFDSLCLLAYTLTASFHMLSK